MDGASSTTPLRRAIIICALGYFIDIFDIQLYAVVRIASLTDMGVSSDRLTAVGGYILTVQMLGMMAGAFLWGWLGDRLGRVKALYGSILIYSVGTLACSLVHDPGIYGLLRFFTGFGLAGETGAAVTMISEMMSKEKRGWGLAAVAGFGFLGPVCAVAISWFFEWRAIYVVAGILGLALLILRLRLIEPALFEKQIRLTVKRGDLMLLMQPRQATVFFFCLLIGFASVYSWNLLNFFSAELGRAVLGDAALFRAKTCLFLFYAGAAIGDFTAAALSQVWRSRRKALAAFFALSAVVSLGFLLIGPVAGLSVAGLYTIYLFLGLGAGSWILMCILAAEQFGTNIRATTAILISNLVRGFSILLVLSFQGLREFLSIPNAAALIGVVLYAGAFFALTRLRETHGLDLDYVERLEKPGI